MRYPHISPTIIEIGPLKIHWYGLMYVLAFSASYFLMARQQGARRLGLRGAVLQNLLCAIGLGLLLGARIGYILFYQYGAIGTYLRHPLEIIALWHGGMSFHGGLLGAVCATVVYCRITALPLGEVGDALIVTAPVGLALGRIGNFINGELFGRPSSLPWAMVFPGAGPLPRHPSQLYEAMLEGVVLFTVLWILKDRPHRPGAMVCLFLAGYGASRCFVEFFRQPDPQLGLLWGARVDGADLEPRHDRSRSRRVEDPLEGHPSTRPLKAPARLHPFTRPEDMPQGATGVVHLRRR